MELNWNFPKLDFSSDSSVWDTGALFVFNGPTVHYFALNTN